LRRGGGWPSGGLAEAVVSGEFSLPQLAAVGEATERQPEATERLLEIARRRSLGELQDECRRFAAEG
jgi:hypothetical protein